MDTIITFEGNALAILRTALSGQPPYRVRIAVDAGEVKIKVNEGTWTPGLPDATVEQKGA